MNQLEYNRAIASVHMPEQIKMLPISPAGFPTPWFVAWMKDGTECAPGQGEPDFRVIGASKMTLALRQERCWVCGERLGVYKAFTIGPMCAINRVISEPPSHRQCAIFSATACPFLSRPRMKRNEKNLPADGKQAAGLHIARNPGAVCVWITKSFHAFRPHVGAPGLLFHIGDPLEVLWFAEGRRANRAEVMASIDSGYPLLADVARQDGSEALAQLERQRAATVATLVPAA